MSLIVSFKGQFKEYPLPETYHSPKLRATRRTEAYFEELLRDHISEKEFNQILEAHKKKNDQLPQTKSNPYQKSKYQESEQKFLTKAHEVMTKRPECLDITDSIATALEKMLKHSHRHFPVLENGTMVGILSDRDILSIEGIKHKALVKDHMQNKVISAKEEGLIKVLIQVMLSENIGALPVLNKQNELTGIITRTDLLKVLANIPTIQVRG